MLRGIRRQGTKGRHRVVGSVECLRQRAQETKVGLHGVPVRRVPRLPAYAYPKTKPSAAKNIDFGRLFGDECGLPLRQDNDATDELETLGDGGQVAKEGQRLMEHRLVGISSPAFSVGGVSTEYMIVGEEVFVAEILGGLSVVSDGFRVGTYLSLRESHTYLHTQPPFRITSRIHAKEWSTQQCIREVNRAPCNFDASRVILTRLDK
jgi:hypothetical protein